MAFDDIDLDKPLMLFGRDVRKIPCFRDSIINGLGYSFVGGLLVFMFTSKPRLASHCTVGSFVSFSIIYFIVCRQRWAHQKFSMAQIHAAVHRGLSTENKDGTKEESKVEVIDV